MLCIKFNQNRIANEEFNLFEEGGLGFSIPIFKFSCFLKHEKTIIWFFYIFFEITKYLGIKRICKLDSETLTSTSQEPVGLSSNRKASGVCRRSPPNTTFYMRKTRKILLSPKNIHDEKLLRTFFYIQIHIKKYPNLMLYKTRNLPLRLRILSP